jgi:protein transport protein SEC61 subunit gamma-like protein
VHPEYKKIAWATSIGFLIMGFVGFFVKIIHIPIHNILVHIYRIVYRM